MIIARNSVPERLQTLIYFYDWGREMVLVPMAPKTHERIKEVMRNSRYLRSIDEVFAELLNRYEKEELQK